MTAQQSSRQPAPGTGTSLPPGAQIVVRDEEWLVKNVTRTDHDGDRIEAVGVSEFVRDQEAVFFTGLERTRDGAPGIELMDPAKTTLISDDSPNFRRSRLFLEAILRKTPWPSRSAAWLSRTASCWIRSRTSSGPRSSLSPAGTCALAC